MLLPYRKSFVMKDFRVLSQGVNRFVSLGLVLSFLISVQTVIMIKRFSTACQAGSLATRHHSYPWRTVSRARGSLTSARYIFRWLAGVAVVDRSPLLVWRNLLLLQIIAIDIIGVILNSGEYYRQWYVGYLEYIWPASKVSARLYFTHGRIPGVMSFLGHSTPRKMTPEGAVKAITDNFRMADSVNLL